MTTNTQGGHGLPIDLVEPCAPAPQGDRVPCHLFMPEVGWPATLGPVLRPERSRQALWLRAPVDPYRVEPASLTAICLRHEFRRVARWGLAVLAIGFVVGFCAPPAKSAPVVVLNPARAIAPARPAPKPAAKPAAKPTPYTAPMALTPNRPVSCERDRLGRCAGGVR